MAAAAQACDEAKASSQRDEGESRVEYRVGRLDEISEQGCSVVQAGDVQVGVIRSGDRIYAYENRCVHQGGPVCRGEVLGAYEEILGPDRRVVGQRFREDRRHLVCPWHGWEYEVETGTCVADRRLRLTAVPVRLEGDEVYVVVGER